MDVRTWWADIKYSSHHFSFFEKKMTKYRFLHQQTTEGSRCKWVVEGILRPHSNVTFNKLFFVICLSPQTDKRSSAQHNISLLVIIYLTRLGWGVTGCHAGLGCITGTLSGVLTVGGVSVSASGLDSMQLSEKERISTMILIYSQCKVLLVKLKTQRLVYQGCSPSPRSAPGLLKHPSP